MALVHQNMSKEEKELMSTKLLKEMQEKNQKLMHRHQEVEADKRFAEEHNSSITTAMSAARSGSKCEQRSLNDDEWKAERQKYDEERIARASAYVQREWDIHKLDQKEEKQSLRYERNFSRRGHHGNSPVTWNKIGGYSHNDDEQSKYNEPYKSNTRDHFRKKRNYKYEQNFTCNESSGNFEKPDWKRCDSSQRGFRRNMQDKSLHISSKVYGRSKYLNDDGSGKNNQVKPQFSGNRRYSDQSRRGRYKKEYSNSSEQSFYKSSPYKQKEQISVQGVNFSATWSDDESCEVKYNPNEKNMSNTGVECNGGHFPSVHSKSSSSVKCGDSGLWSDCEPSGINSKDINIHSNAPFNSDSWELKFVTSESSQVSDFGCEPLPMCTTENLKISNDDNDKGSPQELAIAPYDGSYLVSELLVKFDSENFNSDYEQLTDTLKNSLTLQTQSESESLLSYFDTQSEYTTCSSYDLFENEFSLSRDVKQNEESLVRDVVPLSLMNSDPMTGNSSTSQKDYEASSVSSLESQSNNAYSIYTHHPGKREDTLTSQRLPSLLDITHSEVNCKTEGEQQTNVSIKPSVSLDVSTNSVSDVESNPYDHSDWEYNELHYWADDTESSGSITSTKVVKSNKSKQCMVKNNKAGCVSKSHSSHKKKSQQVFSTSKANQRSVTDTLGQNECVDDSDTESS